MSAAAFLKIIQHPVKFRMFLFSKLPSAFFSGVRVKYADEQKCEVTVPFKWFSQNPFRSTYFACLGMAAEMSTGVLALMHTYNTTPAISMLVQAMQATFTKKATTLTTFTCQNGAIIKQAIETAMQTGEAQIVQATTIGVNEKGDKVAEFLITWTFKRK
jgi:Domain of unknown function (DUF4442)